MAPTGLGKRKSRTRQRAVEVRDQEPPPPALPSTNATAAPDQDEGDEDDDAAVDTHEVFRRHFEARFKPLTGAGRATAPRQPAAKETPEPAIPIERYDAEHGPGGPDGADLDSQDGGSEWGGLSDGGVGEEEDAPNGERRGTRRGGAAGRGRNDPANRTRTAAATGAVEVVDHSAEPLAAGGAAAGLAPLSKKELKTYMSSRPPSLSLTAGRDREAKAAKARGARGTSGRSADPTDSADLLANDLALQRLLSESHLLSEAAALAGGRGSTTDMAAAAAAASSSSSSPSAAASFAAGRLRRRTTDLRMRALGSRESVFAQKKMPMAMRKGIALAAADREARRRKEARECGLVLERPAAKKTGGARTRAGPGNGIRRRGDVGAPSVGKLRGAELRISARDIRAVEGTRPGADGGRRKKRR